MDTLVWAVIVGFPATGLVPTLLVRRWHRRGWTRALLGVAIALAVVYEGGLLYGAVTGNVCLGDCYAAPTAERVAGQVVFSAALLSLLIGVGAPVAFVVTTVWRRRT